METIGTILAFVWLGGMVALPFALFALLWHKAGEIVDEKERRRHGPSHAW